MEQKPLTMAKITLQVVKKPIEQRYIDAACIYWEVERTYFHKTKPREKSLEVQRRNILYYLIKNNTSLNYKDIAEIFGFSSRAPVIEGIETIEAFISVGKGIYRQISNDINQIQAIADKLDADFIEREVILINNRLVLENKE